MQGRQLQRPIKDTLTSEWALSRKHPPTLKSSSRANFHKVLRSHQTLLFARSHFARSHFTRSHFTHSHFTRSHFTRSHEKIEETLFCDMWLPFHSPPPSGCLMRLFPFSRAVDYITAPPRTTEHPQNVQNKIEKFTNIPTLGSTTIHLTNMVII